MKRRHLKRKHPDVPIDTGDAEVEGTGGGGSRAGTGLGSIDEGVSGADMRGTSAEGIQLAGLSALGGGGNDPHNHRDHAQDGLSWMNMGDSSLRPPIPRNDSNHAQNEGGFDLLPPPPPLLETGQRPIFDYTIGGPEDLLFPNPPIKEVAGGTGSTGGTWTPSAFDALLEQLEQGKNSGVTDGAIDGARDTDERRPSTATSTLRQPSVVSPPLYNLSPRARAYTTGTSTYNPLSDHSLIRRATELFFTHSSRYFTFLHQPTFDPHDSAHPHTLIAGITCTGLLFSPDPADRAMAEECYTRGKALMVDDAAWRADMATSTKALASLQALVLLSTFAIMGLGGDETQVGLRMHAKCVEVGCLGWQTMLTAACSETGIDRAISHDVYRYG